MIKTIPKKRNTEKAKWLSEEALQIVKRRREAKGEGEKERYILLNAKFQRIARRDKKAFLCEQCKEIEKNNIMGKIRHLFKNIRDSRGTFHAKMGTIKDRDSIDLTEAEDIKKKWQKYTEEIYKKYLNDPDKHGRVITQLEPDILEYEVRWSLGSITVNKPSGGDGIQTKLFQVLKDDAVKVPQYASAFRKLSSGHRTGKGQFSFKSQRKAISKKVQTTTQLHSFHMLTK